MTICGMIKSMNKNTALDFAVEPTQGGYKPDIQRQIVHVVIDACIVMVQEWPLPALKRAPSTTLVFRGANGKVARITELKPSEIGQLTKAGVRKV
jgi:hypothetical protein